VFGVAQQKIALTWKPFFLTFVFSQLLLFETQFSAYTVKPNRLLEHLESNRLLIFFY